LRPDLRIGANLLAFGLAGLRLLTDLLPLDPGLLALDLSGLRLLADPLPLDSGLLAFDPRRTSLSFDTRLLTLDANLLTVDSGRLALDASLLTLDSHLLALDAWGLRAHDLLTLGSRRLLAGLLPLGSLRAPIDLVLVWPSQCRGCDRQRGDSRGEKYPGHRKISFRTARTVRSAHRSNH